MTDRAAKLAREITDHTTVGFPLLEGEYTTEELVQAIAAALRSYAEERLEESAVALGRLNVDWSASGAAKLVRSFKSRE